MTRKYKFDPRNVRLHPERNKDLIRQSLEEVGAGRSILISGDDTIIAGNGVYEQAQQLGLKVREVIAERDELIAVKRPDLIGEDAIRAAIFDNSTSDLSTWDVEALRQLEADMPSILAGLDEVQAELEAALEALPDPGDGGDEFDATPDDGPTRVQPGDLWIIGGVHRLIVGDCTDPATVARLMQGERADMVWTDPPYNVNYESNAGDIQNDNMSADEFRAFLVSVFRCVDSFMELGATYYIAHSDAFSYEFIGAVRDVGWVQARPPVIQWIKDSAVLSRGDYHSQTEPLLYGWKSGAAHLSVKDRTQTTAWHIARPKRSDDHPTEKPIELVSRAISNSSNSNALILDPFLGSGTTLIAAHRTGRRCYGCEIEPRYADVILRRAEAEGLTVERAP